MKQNISVVIIHYNTPELLKKLIYQLQSTRYHLELIVVDNASKESLAAIKKTFPSVQFIENTRNQGFSFAANQGVLASHGRWILFLNPDILISAQQCYEMMRAAESQKLDAVSPQFSDPNYSKSFPSFFSLLQEFTPLHHFPFLHPKGKKTLVGGCVMIKKSVVQEIGGWDERFFLWFEDSDLTYQLEKKGKSFGFLTVDLFHFGGASVSALPKSVQLEYFFHSLDIFSRKHFVWWQQNIIQTSIIKRFSSRTLYPITNSGYSWVVPNMLEPLLSDFLETNWRFFSDQQLIVVSSAIKGKKIWEYRKKYPNVRFIFTTENRGFSFMVNIGFRTSTTPYIGTLNDDVILNTRSLRQLEKHIPDSFGALNPLIFSIDQKIETAGILIEKKGKAHPITTIPNTPLFPTQASNAACVLYSNDALEQVGLFDERFGSYLEDVDLSLRFDRAGFSQYVVRDSRVIHAKHQTSHTMLSYKKWLDVKNWCLVVWKNWSWLDLIIHSPSLIIERFKNVSGALKK